MSIELKKASLKSSSFRTTNFLLNDNLRLTLSELLENDLTDLWIFLKLLMPYYAFEISNLLFK
jgi:hypothetical protein